MSELSIFVDESGDFGDYAKHSPYYAVTMVFHDQNISLSKQLDILDNFLKNKGYENTAIHSEPLIRREEIYKNATPNERRALFTKLYYFILHSDIQYKTFLYEKIHFEDNVQLETKMTRDISFFFRHHIAFFQRFDRIIVYYDNGQRQITKLLNTVLKTELVNYEMRRVHPVNYRLFQAADLLCTLALLEKRYELNQLTRSDLLLFHSRKSLRKDFLKRLKEKEFKS